MAGHFLERYCERTTVHGFKYLVGKQHILQKLFWGSMIVFSVFCTVWLIASLAKQISRNPIIIYRDDTAIDVTKIPFPAVTVCETGNSTYADSDIYVGWLDLQTFKLFAVQTEIGKCRTVNFCDQNNFLGDEVERSIIFKYFKKFNDENVPENRTTPLMTTSSEFGINIYIHMIVFDSENVRIIRHKDEKPFILTIHSPFELPTKEHQKFYVSGTDTDTFFVTPQLNTIDETMIEMEPHERNCFLSNEKSLTLYKIYNEANCMAECKSNFFVAQCGCVPEHIIANRSTQICLSTDFCIKDAESKFKSDLNVKCDCLPSCSHLTYIVKRFKADFTDTNYLYKLMGNTIIHSKIKFKSADDFPIVRRKHSTVTEIFAFTGGLLGLFLGISVISFAEVVNILLQPLFKNISGTICFKKRSSGDAAIKGSVAVKVKSYFSFYLKESSIHSFNFIADSNNCLERLFWLLSFSVSITGGVFMIQQLYQTMDFKAVTLVIDDQVMDVSEIPFPAITIFGRIPSTMKLMYPQIQSFDEVDSFFKDPKPKEPVQFSPATRAAFMLITAEERPYDPQELIDAPGHEKQIVEEVLKFSRSVWFKKQAGSFGKFSSVPFAETLTKRSVAFTFNILAFDELFDKQTISADFWYKRSVILNDRLETRKAKFPWHASASESLELEMFVDPDTMTSYSEAFTVHPPNELPMKMLRDDIFEFDGGRKLDILITPSVIRSDESLKTLQPSDRSCYFRGERKLRFFEIYTKHNCEVECFSNFSPKTCGCVQFYSVRDSETRACSILENDTKCDLELRSDFRDLKQSGLLASCSCLSSCDSISYNIEIRESKLQNNEFSNTTQFSFRFAENDFNPLRRQRRFTIIDFLSNVGGVLGLFAGVSVLSFVEVLCFFILRVASNNFASGKSQKHEVIFVRPAN